MAAYVIVDVNGITDRETYDAYRKMVMPTLEAFGGRFLVRGGEAERLEGDWQPGRIVILLFDSVARAKEWWSSDLYRPARDKRQSVSSARMIVVQGV